MSTWVMDDTSPPHPDDDSTSPHGAAKDSPPSNPARDSDAPASASDDGSAFEGSSFEDPASEDSSPETRENNPPYGFIPPGSARPHPDPASQQIPNRPSVLRYVQVVLHEWIANMLQHAEFGNVTPQIEITVRADQRYVSCSVIDNSHGFDLADALAKQRNEARALPERGMGLRIISACTEQCAYRSLPDGRYRFEFSIPVDHDPWLSTLF